MRSICLKVLWLDKSIAFSLDLSINGAFVPLTEFYFWPQRDAWEDIKIYLEKINWVNKDEAIIILNQITEVINYWQNKAEIGMVDINSAKVSFPNVSFVGSD